MSLVPLKKLHSAHPIHRSGADFEKIFDNLFTNAFTNINVPSPSVTDLTLRMDVSETPKAYIVHTDIPGVEEQDIEITINENILTITGEKHAQKEEDNKNFLRVERTYGSFTKSLQLPLDADENKVKANLNNGVLEIEISKTKEPEKKIKKIPIKS
jgi:HSP20 family protein